MKARRKATWLEFVYLVFPLPILRCERLLTRNRQITLEFVQIVVDKIISINIYTTILISPTFTCHVFMIINNYCSYIAKIFS